MLNFFYEQVDPESDVLLEEREREREREPHAGADFRSTVIFS